MIKGISQLHSNFGHSSGFEKVLAPGISSAKIACQKYPPTLLSFPILEKKKTLCPLHTYVIKEHKPVTNHSLPSVRPKTSLFLYTKLITDHLQSIFLVSVRFLNTIQNRLARLSLFHRSLLQRESSRVRGKAFYILGSHIHMFCMAWPPGARWSGSHIERGQKCSNEIHQTEVAATFCRFLSLYLVSRLFSTLPNSNNSVCRIPLGQERTGFLAQGTFS